MRAGARMGRGMRTGMRTAMEMGKRRYYFRTRDLILVAALSAAGGALSAYIGYLGNLLNQVFGVPFGAGQWMAGLHVFWFVLARAMVGRTGAGTLAGVLKGIVEMFAGSTHGLPIVLVSATEGLLVDIALLPFARPSLAALAVAGGISSASNVLVFQAMYFSGVSWGYIALMAAFAFGSGVIFGGYFANGVLDTLAGARIVRARGPAPARSRRLNAVVTAIMAVALAGGAVYYYARVYQPPWTGPTCTVEGKVARPYVYRPVDFEDETTTVTAELKGQVTYRPPAEYVGVPLREILERARVEPAATTVRVLATDGYEAEFELAEIMERPEVIIARNGDTLEVVAAGYEGACWVRMVNRILVE